jgi:hypothetical protein
MAELEFPAFPAVGQIYDTGVSRWQFDGTRWRRLAGAAAIAAGSVDTDAIIDGAVTQPKLAGSSVGQAQLADNTVTHAKLVDGAVGQTKLGDGVVTAAKLADNAVTLPRIASGSVDNSKIAAGAAIAVSKLGANTPTLSSYLRGDGSWVTIDSLPVEDHGNAGAALTVDLSSSAVHIITLTAATLALTLTDAVPDDTVKRSILFLVHDATTSSRAVTWPAAMRWPGGTAPTLNATTANAINVIEVLSRDDGIHFGFTHGNYVGP